MSKIATISRSLILDTLSDVSRWLRQLGGGKVLSGVLTERGDAMGFDC